MFTFLMKACRIDVLPHWVDSKSSISPEELRNGSVFDNYVNLNIGSDYLKRSIMSSEPVLDAGTPADSVGTVVGTPDGDRTGASHIPACRQTPSWPQ